MVESAADIKMPAHEKAPAAAKGQEPKPKKKFTWIQEPINRDLSMIRRHAHQPDNELSMAVRELVREVALRGNARILPALLNEMTPETRSHLASPPWADWIYSSGENYDYSSPAITNSHVAAITTLTSPTDTPVSKLFEQIDSQQTSLQTSLSSSPPNPGTGKSTRGSNCVSPVAPTSSKLQAEPEHGSSSDGPATPQHVHQWRDVNFNTGSPPTKPLTQQTLEFEDLLLLEHGRPVIDEFVSGHFSQSSTSTLDLWLTAHDAAPVARLPQSDNSVPTTTRRLPLKSQARNPITGLPLSTISATSVEKLSLKAQDVNPVTCQLQSKILPRARLSPLTAKIEVAQQSIANPVLQPYHYDAYHAASYGYQHGSHHPLNASVQAQTPMRLIPSQVNQHLFTPPSYHVNASTNVRQQRATAVGSTWTGFRGNELLPKTCTAQQERIRSVVTKGQLLYEKDAMVRHDPKTKVVAKRPIHVFIDLSNIMIGWTEGLKHDRGIASQRHFRMPPFNFSGLHARLVRGRQAKSQYLVGSKGVDQEVPSHVFEAEALGYTAQVLTRVQKGKKSGSTGYDISEEEAFRRGSKKNGEQCVDEMLHYHMLKTILDELQTPGTIVLATGDAAAAEFSEGFKAQVDRALNAGFHVEVHAWSRNTSAAWKDVGFQKKWANEFRLHSLDDIAEELFASYPVQH